jgi:hypothetical protein
MAKKKIQMTDLGKSHKKEHLRMVHPFLKKDFRTLEKKELNNPEVFAELFGNSETFDASKLRAIYEYQK